MPNTRSRREAFSGVRLAASLDGHRHTTVVRSGGVVIYGDGSVEAKAGRGRADVLRDEFDRIVRTMFVLYTLLIVGGIVVFVTVGLTQQ